MGGARYEKLPPGEYFVLPMTGILRRMFFYRFKRMKGICFCKYWCGNPYGKSLCRGGFPTLPKALVHQRSHTGGLKTRPYGKPHGKPLCRGGFPTLPKPFVHQRRFADRCSKISRFLNTCREKIWKFFQCRLAKIGTFSPVGWRCGGGFQRGRFGSQRPFG